MPRRPFYRVGVSVEESRRILDEQLANLKEMARFVAAQICASVLGDVRVLTNRQVCRGPRHQRACTSIPKQIRESYLVAANSTEEYPWTLDPHVLERLIEGQLRRRRRG